MNFWPSWKLVVVVARKLHEGYCYVLHIALQCLGFGGKILYFGEIGNPGDQLLGFLNFFGGWGGMLGLSHIGDILILLPVFREQPQQSVSRVSGFPCLLE